MIKPAPLVFLIGLAVAMSGCGTLRPERGKYNPSFATWSIQEGSSRGIPYVILTSDLKRGASPFERLPLIVALPGRGVPALDYVRQLETEARKRNFIVLSFNYLSLPKLDLVYPMIERLAFRYPLRNERVVFVGSSAGALIGHHLIVGNPAYWTAAVFVASPPFDTEIQDKMMRGFPPILFVHGGRDDQFDVRKMRTTVKASKKRGAKISLVTHSRAGHEHRPEWDEEIFNWIEKNVQK